MKLNILILLSFLSLSTVNAQNSTEQIITKTPRNGHSIGSINGLYYVDYVDKYTKPFSGKFIELGYDNELLSECNYKNGKLHGAYIEYSKYDITFIRLKANYVNGKKVGQYTEYWRPNHKKSECYYNQKGERNGTYISYAGFSKEEPEVIGKYVNDKYDSTWTWYYEGKITKSIMTYKLGQLNGISIDYFDNGQKKTECNYVNNNKEGKEIKFNEDGSKFYSSQYKNGKLDGTEYYYFSNGKVEKEGNYSNGVKKGKFVWYKEDGSIKEETMF